MKLFDIGIYFTAKSITDSIKKAGVDFSEECILTEHTNQELSHVPGLKIKFREGEFSNKGTPIFVLYNGRSRIEACGFYDFENNTIDIPVIPTSNRISTQHVKYLNKIVTRGYYEQLLIHEITHALQNRDGYSFTQHTYNDLEIMATCNEMLFLLSRHVKVNIDILNDKKLYKLVCYGKSKCNTDFTNLSLKIRNEFIEWSWDLLTTMNLLED